MFPSLYSAIKPRAKEKIRLIWNYLSQPKGTPWLAHEIMLHSPLKQSTPTRLAKRQFGCMTWVPSVYTVFITC
jgi:hypothetical protein